MDALKIIEIVNQYKYGVLDFAEASLSLIILGLNAEEVKKLLLDVEVTKTE